LIKISARGAVKTALEFREALKNFGGEEIKQVKS
jgi:hypothetical protein